MPCSEASPIGRIWPCLTRCSCLCCAAPAVHSVRRRPVRSVPLIHRWDDRQSRRSWNSWRSSPSSPGHGSGWSPADRLWRANAEGFVLIYRVDNGRDERTWAIQDEWGPGQAGFAELLAPLPRRQVGRNAKQVQDPILQGTVPGWVCQRRLAQSSSRFWLLCL
jgi:hypothetical protein